MRNILSTRISVSWLEKKPKCALYLAGCVLYVAVMAFENSAVAVVLPERFFTLIKIAALGLLCIAAILPLETPAWYMVLTVILLCLSTYLYKTSTSTLPLFFISMTFGSYGVDRRKVFSTIGLTTVVSAAVIIILAISGLIPNIIRTNNYGLLKYDMGFGYGSQPGLYIETVAICTILANDGKLSKKKGAILALSAVVAFLLWNFLTSLLITIVLLVLVLTVQRATSIKRNRKLMKTLSTLAYPVVASVTIAVTACFNSSNQILGVLDQALSWRLTLGKQALNWHGVSFFGQPVYFKGFGIDAAQSTIAESGGGGYELVDANSGYTYVDSSYILYLVLLGALFLFIVLGIYVAITRMAATRSSSAMVILLLLAIQCSINPLLVEIYVNPTPILLGIYAYEQFGTRAPCHMKLKNLTTSW